jgi:hypothetical protein
MKYFKVTTDDEIFVIQGKTKIEAEMAMIDEKFRSVLDDDLADKYDIVEISESEKDYIQDYTPEELELIQERTEYFEAQVDQIREDGIHSHMGRR